MVHSYRTLLPLVYPPHSIALGSLYTASLLLSFEQQASPTREGESSSGDLAKQLNSHSKWEEQYHTRAEDLEGVFSHPLSQPNLNYNLNFISNADFAHTFLDLLLQFTQSTSTSASTSPSTPSSPSPHLSNRERQLHTAQHPYKADQLIRLKIAMRETEHAPRRRKPLGNSDPSALYSSEKLGQNEGTVRFLFFPLRFEGDAV